MANIEVERIYSVRLKHNVKRFPRWLRAKKSIKYIKNFMSRHMKVPPENVKIDNALNETIWSRGAQKPPAKLRLRAVKFDDGVVEVELAK